MVKPAKLYQQLVVSRGGVISFRDFVRLLEAFGFVPDRTVGSHRQYVHPRVPRSLPVQPVGKDTKKYQVRELLEIVEAYGLHIEG